MKGHVCLLCTNKTKEEVQAAMKEFEVEDFAVAGIPAEFTVFLQKGTESLEAYPHSLEPYLK